MRKGLFYICLLLVGVGLFAGCKSKKAVVASFSDLEGKANDVKKETGMKRMIMALIFLSLLVSTFVAGCGIDQRKRDGRTGASPVKVVPLPYEEGPFPAF